MCVFPKSSSGRKDKILLIWWLEGIHIYEVGEAWVAGVDGGKGDEVGWEVSVVWEEGATNHQAESW